MTTTLYLYQRPLNRCEIKNLIPKLYLANELLQDLSLQWGRTKTRLLRPIYFLKNYCAFSHLHLFG